MYSLLVKVGASENQNKSKEVRERPKYARPSAQALHSLYIWETKNLIL